MAEVLKWPDASKVKDEACKWVARLHSGDISAEEKSQFEAWCTAHPLHARIYEEVSATWGEFTAIGPMVRAMSFAQSASEATALKRSSRRLWLAAAAVGMFAAVGTAFYVARSTSDAIHSTIVGEQATVRLPDGSSMDLNSNSRVRVQFVDDARVIHLEKGEAFFRVAHDMHRPFWVVSSGAWVRAVGTAFNVYVRPSGMQVTVSEGVVKVGNATSSLTDSPTDSELDKTTISVLNAGEQTSIGGQTRMSRKLSATELARFTSWRSGSLYFEQEPLGAVVDELNRYTNVRLVVENESLRSLSVGGSFEANPQGAEALLATLQEGLALRVRREGDRAYIESARDR